MIEPLSGKPPERIVIRLRHPEGKPIQSVTVQGMPHTKFDPQKETITVEPANEAIIVRAEYTVSPFAPRK